MFLLNNLGDVNLELFGKLIKWCNFVYEVFLEFIKNMVFLLKCLFKSYIV